MAWVTKSSEEQYDAPQEPERVYTRSEKAKNWWYYHKWAVVITVIVVAIVAWIVHDIVTSVAPDYQVGWVGSVSLPEETATALQDALAQYADDRNGDGKVVVEVNQYVFDLSGSGQSADQTMEAYNKMAGMTRLNADLTDGVNSLFLLEDPEGFQAMSGALRYLDGTLPEEGASDWQNMVYRWSDCPVLAGLDLGSYQPMFATGETSLSSQDLLSGAYVGCSGAWNDTQTENLAGSENFWQALTAGAQPMSGGAG